LGVAWTDHLLPFQCSTSVSTSLLVALTVYHPAAVQLVAEVHEIPAS
jgi:hypothetical protein